MPSIELKPCPFCGGEAEFGGNDCTGYFVECLTCGTNDPLPNLSFSMEEVAAAWNHRAERTCRIRGGECDQCGAIIHEHANLYWVPVGEGMRTVEHRDVHYCPNCGAKVVEE